MGIGDWGLGIGDWAQSPIPNPQSPVLPFSPSPDVRINLNLKIFLARTRQKNMGEDRRSDHQILFGRSARSTSLLLVWGSWFCKVNPTGVLVIHCLDCHKGRRCADPPPAPHWGLNPGQRGGQHSPPPL